MKKLIISIIIPLFVAIIALTGCSKEEKKLSLEDGYYYVNFTTDSSMFHLNEACDGVAVMKVSDGVGEAEIILPSKNTVNLFYGVKDDAQKEGAVLLEPVVVTVRYDDGMEEEVNSFLVPVHVIDEEFDLALIGTKGVWYDHKVMVSNPVPVTEEELLAKKNSDEEDVKTDEITEVISEEITEIYVKLEGGTGKAKLESPTSVNKTDKGYEVTLTWSSPNYDYMIVNGEKYLPVNEEGNSVFVITFEDISSSVTVVADTVAMSEPHEIEYTIVFSNEEIVAE